LGEAASQTREIEYVSCNCKVIQESPADAGIPARRKTMKKIPPFRGYNKFIQVGNPVFIVIKFLIQITSTYNR